MPRPAAHIAIAAALALAAAAAPAADAPAAPRAPVGPARFTSHARFVDAELSPKGTWLAVVSVEGGRRSLSFIRMADRKVVGHLPATNQAMIGTMTWANDERLVAGLWEQHGSLDLARPVSYGELLSVKPEGASNTIIFGWRAGRLTVGSKIRRAEPERAFARVVDRLRKDDRNIMVNIGQFDEVGDRFHRLAKLDVFSGMKTEVTQSPVLNASYLLDEDGEPRLAYSYDASARWQYSFRDGPLGWRPLTSLPGFTADSRPRRFHAASRSMEVVDSAPGGFGLYSVNVDTGARSTIATTRLAPPGSILRDQVTYRPLAVESEPDLPEWQFLDETHPLSRVLAGLLDSYPGRHVELDSVTDDQKLAIAHVYGDRDPGRFLLVDVARRSAEPMLETRPWIVPEEMAEMTAFHIKASDGHPLHGYVTYPRGLAPGVKPPLVVLPHGGPFGVRDSWGFDSEVQLLASEGFAVLQVNFRGSGGYGRAYQEAGYRHKGDRMIEDLLDATRWLVKKGQVDGARMCTYGASYGGYAALQAVSLAPALFRCAAGFAGVYDLTRLEHNDDIVESGIARGYVRTTTGADEEALRAASPVFHADKITVPVLLIHGTEDTRVPIVHAEKLRDALTRLGRPPEWLAVPREGHGFYDEEARARMYAKLVSFLKQHTAPAAPPAALPAPPAATPAAAAGASPAP